MRDEVPSRPSDARVAVICWVYLLFVAVLVAVFLFVALKYLEPMLPPEIPRRVNPRQDPLGALILVASVLVMFLPAMALMQLIALAALKPFFAQPEVVDALTREPKPLVRGRLGRRMLDLVWPQ